MEFLAIGLLVILAVGVYLWKDTSSSPVVVDTSSEIVADANDNGITS